MLSMVSTTWAQTSPVKTILEQVERNNTSLRAYQVFLQGDSLRRKSQNNLPDPQIGYYYLPLGNHSSDDYSEFQISQTVQFPTVYYRQNRLISEQNQLEVSHYRQERRDILLEAKMLCTELTYINQKAEVKRAHLERAEQVYKNITAMEQSGQTGLIELNKSKIAWLQAQFELQQYTSERETLLNKLQALNGGISVVFEQQVYGDSLVALDTNTLWNEVLTTDPSIRSLHLGVDVANQQMAVFKSKSLPNLTAGFNHQGVPGETYSGLYAGLSIPLWSNAHKVKSAEQLVVSQKLTRDAEVLTAQTEFQSLCKRYSSLFEKYLDYKSAMDASENETLLLKAYDLGEISYQEYYLELHFYHQAIDQLLAMEKELHLLRCQIYKHQL